MHDAIQHWCLAPPSVRHPLLVTRLSMAGGEHDAQMQRVNADRMFESRRTLPRIERKIAQVYDIPRPPILLLPPPSCSCTLSRVKLKLCDLRCARTIACTEPPVYSILDLIK